MKKIFLTTAIAVFLFICLTGTQAQTTQTKLNQVELMKQLLGNWQTNIGKDTIEIWETQHYGKGYIINVSQVIKGKKNPLYINNMSFDTKDGKFKGFVLYANGDYSTWIGLFTSEKKFSGDMVQNFNPETASIKLECEFENPKEWTWRNFNKEGVKIFESKFIKVK